MKQQTMRCVRCYGLKRIYKIGKTEAYSHANNGGVLVDCPLCLGIGTMPNMVERNRVAEEIKSKVTIKKKKEIHVAKPDL